jgi:predicted RNA binding protein YcfA (HicA-like mRNA interferase family)
MPSRYPVVSGDRLIAALQRAGWIVTRHRGSHVRLRLGNRTVSVPSHSGRAIPIGTLAAILDNAGLTPEQLREML